MYGNFDMIFWPFLVVFSALCYPCMRCVTCPTSCRILVSMRFEMLTGCLQYDVMTNSRLQANASDTLVFLGNTGSTVAAWARSGVVYAVAGKSHVLVGRSGAVLFNSSAVGSNRDLMFTTAKPRKWSHCLKARPRGITPAPLSVADRPLVGWADTPTEQVELELNTVGRVADYVWYNVNFAVHDGSGSGGLEIASNASNDSAPGVPGSIAVYPCTADMHRRHACMHARWRLARVADASALIQTAGGAPSGNSRCVGIDTDGFDGGFGARLHSCNASSAAQRFAIGADGRVHGTDGLCLDIQDGSHAAGASVFVYACGPRPAGNQELSISPVLGGGGGGGLLRVPTPLVMLAQVSKISWLLPRGDAAAEPVRASHRALRVNHCAGTSTACCSASSTTRPIAARRPRWVCSSPWTSPTEGICSSCCRLGSGSRPTRSARSQCYVGVSFNRTVCAFACALQQPRLAGGHAAGEG